jgi:hypothetical protein
MADVRRNIKKNGIEVSFPSKPEPDVLVWLKANKFRWGRTARVWWHMFDEDVWQTVNDYFGKSITEEHEPDLKASIKQLIEEDKTGFMKDHIIIAKIPDPDSPVIEAEIKTIESDQAAQEVAQEIKDELRKELITEEDGFKIYSVDGEAVRKDHIEFTMGGHGYVYDYIPRDEIWIDENLNDKPYDRYATIKHELFEVKKMRDKGLDYEAAHELANGMEEKVRNSDIEKSAETKIYTLPELWDIYSFKNGYNLSKLDLDNIASGTHTKYASIGKLRGTYPNYERDPKFKGIIIDSDYKWFVEVSAGNYKETTNPYKTQIPELHSYDFKKGDKVIFKEQFRDKGDTFTYELLNDPDGMRAEVVPIDSKLNIPPVNIANINEIEKVPEPEVKIISEEIITPTQTEEEVAQIPESEWKEPPIAPKPVMSGIYTINNIDTDSYDYWFERYSAWGKSEVEEVWDKYYKEHAEDPDYLNSSNNRFRALASVAKRKGIISLILGKKEKSVPKSPESVPEPVISVTITDYNSDFDRNKAIENLLDSKWNEGPDKFSEEQLEFIKGYTGYGGLDDEAIKAGEKIDVKALFEYYTPDKVIEKMWGLAYKYGYKDGPICEPSLGVGSFFDRRFVANTIEKHGYEINKYSAKIAKLLYPEAIINDGQEIKHFEQLFIVKNYTVRVKVTPKYSLVIGNPPYGSIGGPYMGMGESTFTHAKNYIEYFILRGLDLLIPGGLLIYIIGAETAAGGKPFLDQGMTKTKEMIMERGKLIDAYRLPSGIFSRTDVTSDIICFKKR